MKANLQKLHSLAVEVRENAYSPYSHFKVGASLVSEKGNTYVGCNVENASYGGTICAERSAILAAVAAEGKKMKIQDIVVVTDSKEAWPPCGLCRQVIFEFATKKTKIHIADIKQIRKSFSMDELLPEAFGPKSLA